MQRPSLKLLVVLGAVGLLALGGTAAALLARGMREVTTSSAEAYRHYLAGVESERKLYHREAIASYAQALALDPTFAMAALRLAGQLAGRDPERARSLVKCATVCTEGLSAREKLIAQIYRTEHVTRDRKELAALVDDFCARYPGDAEALMRKAALLARDGKRDEALALYEQVIQVEPNQAWAYNTLGYAWMARGDFGKAEDYLKRYRYLAPDQANPYDSLGELWANIGRYDEAEESLRKALLIKPDFLPAIAHLGTVAHGRGDHATAAAQYLQAADSADSLKDRLTWAYPAALSLAEAGRADEALAVYERLSAGVVSLPEEDRVRAAAEVSRLRAILLGMNGRLEEAEAALEAALDPGMKVPEERKRDHEQAIAAARGLLAHFRGDHEAAVEFLKLGVRAFEAGSYGFPYYPYPHKVRVTLARSLAALGRAGEAREALAPVLAMNPRYAPALAVASSLPPEAAVRS